MSQAAVEERVETLEERLARGATILFDMEQRGETGAQYSHWYERWAELLEEYESSYAA
jgi:hypothetical protein